MTTELIVVLDMDSRAEALAAVNASGPCQWFKIGAQLFTRLGPEIVKEVQGLGKKVFLDLKYHDIPNTVAHAARAAADLGAGLITIHASGGCAMIEAARKAVEGTATRILAVTVLTSISHQVLNEEIGFSGTPEETVKRLAAQAVNAGAHGIVCSPLELNITRQVLGPEPLIVTPGVRPEWASRDDQARVMTPREAARAGASMVVVGRPILKHPFPAEAVSLILEELNS
ncbi:MAG: orotidine-5'-phosphate decarboxylase [Candidatus Hydrogenedens sp.]|jgi:orotidine-5'-phosphate decarboxylase|nr:orotidine-5'-phosphate decarboxylase [Candidatus Hydrogenedens sp.]